MGDDGEAVEAPADDRQTYLEVGMREMKRNQDLNCSTNTSLLGLIAQSPATTDYFVKNQQINQ